MSRDGSRISRYEVYTQLPVLYWSKDIHVTCLVVAGKSVHVSSVGNACDPPEDLRGILEQQSSSSYHASVCSCRCSLYVPVLIYSAWYSALYTLMSYTSTLHICRLESSTVQMDRHRVHLLPPWRTDRHRGSVASDSSAGSEEAGHYRDGLSPAVGDHAAWGLEEHVGSSGFWIDRSGHSLLAKGTI